jgi:hypothetical protein
VIDPRLMLREVVELRLRVGLKTVLVIEPRE